MVKKLILDEVHRQLGGKVIEFAGFDMPVRYSTDKEEHMVVREKAGLFDVSHMGQFFVSGPQALDLLQYVTSNDVSKLTSGQIQYSCLPNDIGGIVDDILVYCHKPNAEYMLVVNASNIEKDFAWISQFAPSYDCKLENVSDQFCLFALQGPKAASILQKICQDDVSHLKYYTYIMTTVSDVPMCMVSATGYTGAGGFEIMVPNASAEKIWKLLLEVGKEEGIAPVGLGPRDTLRLEMGYCLYGNDINDNTSPIEAGLGWITKFSKKFVNDEYHLSLKEAGVSQKLVGFKLKDKGIPRHGYKILDAQGKEIGEVTSGSISPVLNYGIGMGYVKTPFASIGSEIFIEIRNKSFVAEVVKMPFI